jgi:secretion/DNA translocation related TadE-like protein
VTERGSVVVMMTAAIVVAGMLMLGAAQLGGAGTRKARADTAADAAALAAADELALGRPGVEAANAARTVADANGAVLVSCVCAGRSAQVTVVFHDAKSTARALVTP